MIRLSGQPVPGDGWYRVPNNANGRDYEMKQRNPNQSLKGHAFGFRYLKDGNKKRDHPGLLGLDDSLVRLALLEEPKFEGSKIVELEKHIRLYTLESLAQERWVYCPPEKNSSRRHLAMLRYDPTMFVAASY